MKRYAAALLILIAVSGVASALPENYGIYAFEPRFGARAYGIGGIVSISGGDENVCLANPAGIIRARGIFFSLKDFNSYSIADYFGAGPGAAGIGLVTRQVPDTSISGTIYTFSSSYLFTQYAQEVLGLSLGASLKFLFTEDLISGTTRKSGSGWDADLGISTRPVPWLNIGMLLENGLASGTMGGGTNRWNDNTEEGFPSSLRAGLGIKLTGKDAIFRGAGIKDAMIAFESETSPGGDKPPLMHAGIEFKPNEQLYFRAGLDQRMSDNVRSTIITLGIGTKFEDWNQDLAYNSGSRFGSIIFSALFAPYVPESIKMKKKTIIMNVYEPKDDIATDSDRIIVSGETNAAAVKINGLDVFLDQKGKFRAEMPLYMGKNLVQIKGIYDYDEAVVNRHILRKIKIKMREVEQIEKKKEAVRSRQDQILKKEIEIASIISDPNAGANEKTAAKAEKERLEGEIKMLADSETKIASAEKEARGKQQKIESLATMGVIDVKSGKEFESEDMITRAELSVWLVKAKGLSVPSLSKSVFPDVGSDYWAAPYIEAAIKHGLMKPLADGKFHPEEGVRESESSEIMERFDGLRLK